AAGQERFAELRNLVEVERRDFLAWVLLDLLVGKVREEARRRELLELAAEHSLLRPAQVQPVTRPRDAHVKQPSLLLHVGGRNFRQLRIGRAAVRQLTFDATDQEHDTELETL